MSTGAQPSTAPGGGPTAGPSASVDQLEKQVIRVLNHRSFAKSRGPARLLRHLADLMISNGGRPATQGELARVLELPTAFDPNHSPLVRMHMSKLRRMLQNYAIGDGTHDAVVLELPRSSYMIRAYLRAGRSERADDHGGASHAAASRIGATGLQSLRQLLVVVQFECFTQPQELTGLSRVLASTLVAELVGSARFAAIGPLLRDRVHAANKSIPEAVQHCGVTLYLDGEIALGGRGVQVTSRLMTATGSKPLWTDWIDDPLSSLSADGRSDAAEHLAKRVACRLDECPGLSESN